MEIDTVYQAITEYFKQVKKIIKKKPKALKNLEDQIDLDITMIQGDITDDREYYAIKLTDAENRIVDLEKDKKALEMKIKKLNKDSLLC